MKRPHFSALAFTLLALGFAACDSRPDSSGDPSPGASGKPMVLTTFYPTTYFTQRIAGGAAEVICPLPEDADPIFWQPTAEEIAKFQAADLIVINGASFEKWVEKASLPMGKAVSTAKPLEGDLIRYESAVVHSHGPGGEHAHEGIDGHTWVDPINAKAQSSQILSALLRLMPEQAADFSKRAAELDADLDALDTRLKKVSARLGKTPVFASHPAYNYPARRYGWNLRNLDLDPEAMPTAEQFESIAKLQESHPAKVIIWESAPAPEIAAKFKADLGIDSIEFTPCEMVGAEEIAAGTDYLSLMSQNLDALSAWVDSQ